jgi:hypothetical protein
MTITREELREELAVFPTRAELEGGYPTKEFLSTELARYPTKVDLRTELARYATKEDLRTELARFTTKEELGALREEQAQGFGDLRRYMELLVEDLKAWTKVLFDGTNARIDLMTRHK